MEEGRISKQEAEEIIASFLAKFSERVHMNHERLGNAYAG